MNSHQHITDLCIKKIKDFFNYLKISIKRKIKTPIETIIDEESTINFMNNFVKNINIMESDIIKPFDRGNHYTRMHRMIGRTLSSDEKKIAFKTNIRVFQKLPRSVQTELTFIPDCNLSVIDIFQSDTTYDIFQRVQNLYGYAKYYLKLQKDIKEKQENTQPIEGEVPDGLFGTVKYPHLEDDKQQEVYDDVRKTIGQYESNGLNTALNEVIKELNAPGAVGQEEGMNTIDSAKLMGMATNVAGQLTSKLHEGDITVPELVNDTEMFINDLMNSPMFDGHPDNKQIKQLFGSLMDRVKFMSDNQEEENSMLTQDVDKILGLDD
jgi:hypothetical protein